MRKTDRQLKHNCWRISASVLMYSIHYLQMEKTLHNQGIKYLGRVILHCVSQLYALKDIAHSALSLSPAGLKRGVDAASKPSWLGIP